MHPHPILMQTFHNDRNREVEAILTRQLVDQAYDALALAPAVSGSRHFLVVRILALLASMRTFLRAKRQARLPLFAIDEIAR